MDYMTSHFFLPHPFWPGLLLVPASYAFFTTKRRLAQLISPPPPVRTVLSKHLPRFFNSVRLFVS